MILIFILLYSNHSSKKSKRKFKISETELRKKEWRLVQTKIVDSLQRIKAFCNKLFTTTIHGLLHCGYAPRLLGAPGLVPNAQTILMLVGCLQKTNPGTKKSGHRTTLPGWQAKFRDSWERSFVCSLFFIRNKKGENLKILSYSKILSIYFIILTIFTSSSFFPIPSYNMVSWFWCSIYWHFTSTFQNSLCPLFSIYFQTLNMFIST